jgi:septal ring factor EnvC (AmiA/AmiB activator)
MRGFSSGVVLALAGVGLAAAGVAQVGSPASGSLSTTQAEARRASARAAALDREAKAATDASERATFAAAALAARVEEAEASLASADIELASVREKRVALDRELARERAPVARLLAGLQTQVRRPPVLTLLQPGSIEDAVHLRAVVTAVTPQIATRTALVRRSLERAQALEADATKIAAQRRSVQTQLAHKRTELAALSAAERLKARRAAGAADREAERALAIAQQSRSLATLVRRLDSNPAARHHDAGVKGPDPYRLPVAGQQYGDAMGGGLEIHPRVGTIAVAPGAGRIAFAGPYRGYGSIVIVEHADGWTSLVTGLSATQVAVGQRVVAGSPIGEAPDVGPAIGLELRRNGQRVNPLDHLR